MGREGEVEEVVGIWEGDEWEEEEEGGEGEGDESGEGDGGPKSHLVVVSHGTTASSLASHLASLSPVVTRYDAELAECRAGVTARKGGRALSNITNAEP